jgi:hypothetical protein
VVEEIVIQWSFGCWGMSIKRIGVGGVVIQWSFGCCLGIEKKGRNTAVDILIE